jgi:hypothetical protein
VMSVAAAGRPGADRSAGRSFVGFAAGMIVVHGMVVAVRVLVDQLCVVVMIVVRVVVLVSTIGRSQFRAMLVGREPGTQRQMKDRCKLVAGRPQQDGDRRENPAPRVGQPHRPELARTPSGEQRVSTRHRAISA